MTKATMAPPADTIQSLYEREAELAAVLAEPFDAADPYKRDDARARLKEVREKIAAHEAKSMQELKQRGKEVAQAFADEHWPSAKDDLLESIQQLRNVTERLSEIQGRLNASGGHDIARWQFYGLQDLVRINHQLQSIALQWKGR